MPSVLVLWHPNSCFCNKTLICVLHPVRLSHAVWPDLQTLFLIHKSPYIPSDSVCIRQPALGILPRKALAMSHATAVGICSQAACKQKDNGNRSPKLPSLLPPSRKRAPKRWGGMETGPCSGGQANFPPASLTCSVALKQQVWGSGM